MVGRRLLIVDDEETILETLESIFRQHGYTVVACNSVAEALHSISQSKFDVLIADLNIGQPGDGFTVVSALRRTQPESIALILTGYPAFDSALQAIRAQVDDFLVKPIHPLELVQKVETTVRSHPKHLPLPSKRMSDLLISERHSILASLEEWLARASSEAGVTNLSYEDLVSHLPGVIDELAEVVHTGKVGISETAMAAAREHGIVRATQGFDLTFLLNESTAIRQTVLATIHRNLLLLNMSYLFLDLTKMSDSLDLQWKLTIKSFLESTQRKAA